MNVWELDTAIKPSRYQQWLHGFFYLAALAALWCAYIPLMLQVIVTAVLLMVAVWLRFRNATPIVTRLSTEQDDWFIYLANGQRLKVSVQQYFLWRYLVILSCQNHHIKWPYVLVIFPDSIDADNYRRLQARLRLEAN